jgi:carboxymethylenebutenolidase
MSALRHAYFLVQPQNPNGRGVIVSHEGLGFNGQIVRLCERLASEGYVVVAPDYFFRTGGTPKEGEWWESINAVSDEGLRADLANAAAVLHAHGAKSIGATGFCMGGRISYLAAKWARELGVGAAVPFYGKFQPDLGELHCPVLIFFGGKDPYVSAEEIEATRARHPNDTHIYPENGHAFMRDGDADYEPAAAADAWKRMLAFFDKHLQ